MRLKAEHRIAHIIIVGNLNHVEKHAVFKLGGISHHGTPSNHGAASYKSSVTDFGLGKNNGRAVYKRRRGNLGRLCYPHVFPRLLKLVFVERGNENIQNIALYFGEDLKGKGFAIKKRGGVGL